MAQHPLLARVPDPADRRRNLVSLTDAGRRHLTHLDAVVGRAQDELLAPLSPTDRAELVRLLRVLTTHHGAAGD